MFASRTHESEENEDCVSYALVMEGEDCVGECEGWLMHGLDSLRKLKTA